MGSQKLQPETLEERLIYVAIIATWVFWLAGLLYIVGAAFGYVLLAIAGGRWLGLDEDVPDVHAVPATVWVWVAGMLAMAVALVIAHLDYEHSSAQTLKSFVGWMKGWALLAIYPLAGALLRVRPQIIARATGILAMQTVILAPLFLTAEIVGLPPIVYVSPVHNLIGAGPEFFDVALYGLDETTGKARWRFFAPWSTASAFIASLGLILAYQDRDRRWWIAGIASALIVSLMSGSRLSIIALPATIACVVVVSNVTRPLTWVLIAIGATGSVLLLDTVLQTYQDATDAFNAARAASSRVRTALGHIAVHRWWTEAPVFGHGTLERGGQAVERMLIGSHHTWWGLLFVKGAVGFAALAIPVAWSVVDLAVKAQRDRVARTGLGILLAIVLFSLADNIEVIAYLIWPSLVFIGIAFRRRCFHLYAGCLGSARSGAGSARSAFQFQGAWR